IESAGASPSSSTYKRSFLAANQSARARADGCPDTNALGSFFLARFGVAPLHRAGIAAHHKAQPQQTSYQDHRNQFESVCLLHVISLLVIKIGAVGLPATVVCHKPGTHASLIL